MDVATDFEADMDSDLLKSVLLTALHNDLIGGSVEVSLVITDDTEIQALNLEYRGIDAPTDVLSFSQSEDAESSSAFPVFGVRPLGDIVISGDRVRAQAEEYGHSVRRELAYLAVHGLLHLLGYDHETEAGKSAMREAEEAALGDIRR